MGEHRTLNTAGETPCSLPSGILGLAWLPGWRDWGVRVQGFGAVWLQLQGVSGCMGVTGRCVVEEERRVRANAREYNEKFQYAVSEGG